MLTVLILALAAVPVLIEVGAHFSRKPARIKH